MPCARPSAICARPRDCRGSAAAASRSGPSSAAAAKTADPARTRHRLLPFAAFAERCERHRIQDPASFAEVLHHAGQVYYRPGLFDDRLVIDQSWALDAIYAIFTREGQVHARLERQQGRFTRTDLDLMLWRERGLTADDQRSLLEMMERSGVCFVHGRDDDPSQTEYVAPDLLPEGRAGVADALTADWDAIPGEISEAWFRYPFLSPSIGRTVIAALGGIAHARATYWRYGLLLFDAETRSRALIEAQPDPQGYGGRILIQTRANRAGDLLGGLIDRIEELNQRAGWRGRCEEPRMADRDPDTQPDHRAHRADRLTPDYPPVQPPAQPEVYVSYAWAREAIDPLVDELCRAFEADGLRIMRDKDQIRPGDRISAFMKRLGTGRCVLLILSQAYLRSESCMNELHAIWTHAHQDEHRYLARIVPLIQDDAAIGDTIARDRHAKHWKERYQELAETDPEILGESGQRQLRVMGQFYRSVVDMLALANDLYLSRDRPTLREGGFAVVKGLVRRALEGSSGGEG